jgi:predicted transcriptional regulator
MFVASKVLTKMTDNAVTSDLSAMTTQIVAAYLSKNSLPLSELPSLIQQVHSALAGVGTAPVAAAVERPEPAVAVKKSVTPDYIVCLEDGKKLKMLKRHLKTAFNMTPEQYRERWGLPADYPMVAPNYADQRSKLAKQIGLGTKPRRGAQAA